MGLPNELLLELLQYLTKKELKGARLVSKLWAGCASEHLFTKVYISSHKLNLHVFDAIAQHPLLSRCVRELELDAVHFSRYITMSDYFEILFHQALMVISAREGFHKHRDPQVRQFVAILDKKGLPAQDVIPWAQTQCRDFTFIQEGYRKWMVEAFCEKENLVAHNLRVCLISGLKSLSRLRSVTMRAEWPLKREVGSEGSPLARSWNAFHAYPTGWTFGPHKALKQSRASLQFWTVARALTRAKITSIRSLSIESALAPATFMDGRGAYRSRVDFAVASYCRLEDLKLSLAGLPDEPKVKLYDNLRRLQGMLESMSTLKRFELDLPDDYVNQPVVFFAYKMIFPKNGNWPQLSTFTVRNLEIGTKDLLNLLVTKMPSLRHLTFGNIKLLDGQWEGVVECLRIGNHLLSFKIIPDSELLHRENEDYLLQRPAFDNTGVHRTSRRYVESIGNYVINWWNNPTLRHPNLLRSQIAQQSLEYLPDVFRLCEMNDMGDTVQDLAKHMEEEAARYCEWKQSWLRKTWLENLPQACEEWRRAA